MNRSCLRAAVRKALELLRLRSTRFLRRFLGIGSQVGEKMLLQVWKGCDKIEKRTYVLFRK